MLSKNEYPHSMPLTVDPPVAEMNPAKWKSLLAAWLGWAFDGLDGYLYVMVAFPFVSRLVANEHGTTLEAVNQSTDLTAEVGHKATIIQAVFLVGWAIGGAVFGRLGDRLGRSRTLTLTILTYACFTGLSFFATQWWHLLIFRFLASLGIGGEWAAGSALVSETLHSKHRAWASATLQTGYITGCIAAALTSGAMSRLEPKWVFVVGVLPAFITLWIRRAVPESHEWKSATQNSSPPRVAELFAPNMRRTTILLLIHISIALTTVWAFLFFTPQMIKKLPEAASMSPAEIEHLKTRVTVTYLAVNIIANFAATYLAKLAGYRIAFFVMMLGAIVCGWYGLRTPPTLDNIYWVTSLVGFFGLGLFGLFPMYVPPLFPTLIRTLGSGFTYNSGRVVAAVGTMFAGTLAANAGGPSGAVLWSGVLYIPGLIICLMLPEPPKSEDKPAHDRT